MQSLTSRLHAGTVHVHTFAELEAFCSAYCSMLTWAGAQYHVDTRPAWNRILFIHEHHAKQLTQDNAS